MFEEEFEEVEEEGGEVEEGEEVAVAGRPLEVGEGAYTFLFPKGKEPRYVFEALSAALSEANLVLSPDGVRLKALDPSKVALFSLDIPAVNLEEYNVEDTVKVGLLFTSIRPALKRIAARNKVELGVDAARNRFVIVIYPKKGRESGVYRRFSFPIVRVEEEEVPEPQLEFDATVKIASDAIVDILASAGEISDVVTLMANEDMFAVKAEGEGGKELYAEFPRDHDAVYDLYVGGSVAAKYSVEYLLDFTRKMKGVSKVATIEFGTKKPLKVLFDFAVGTVYMLLAPRID